jgi:urease accessory protein
MEIVREPLGRPDARRRVTALRVDRLTLAKRRWRGTAEDGREFGFDLDQPLEDGSAIFADDDVCYVIEQAPEAVIELRLADFPGSAARVGWMLGNLHFPLEIADGVIRVADDPAIRQMLDREALKYSSACRVFKPLGSAPHGHRH